MYTVPTKQGLNRVAQECEAFGIFYWTLAKDKDLYQVCERHCRVLYASKSVNMKSCLILSVSSPLCIQVRRPYSVRTTRGLRAIKKATLRGRGGRKGTTGSGSLVAELEKSHTKV